MKSTLSALFGVLILAGCALDIPAPAPAAPSAKPEYDVPSEGGTVVRHYDGNDALMWIERHVLFPGTAPTDPRVKTYHSSAADVLQWYEYRRWESVGGVWVKTREQRFSAGGNADKDQGVLVSGKAWSYATAGLPVLTAYYKPDILQAYDSVWAEAAAGNRVLQITSHDDAGNPLGYDRTWFDSGKKSAHALLDEKRQVISAQTYAYEGDNRTELLGFTASTPTTGVWTRELAGYLAGTSSPYRTVWYQAAGTAPAAAGFETSPSAAAPALTGNPAADGSLGPAVLPAPAVSLVALPSWNAPSAWPLTTLQGFEYVLPGANGSTKIRFNKNQLPAALVRAAQAPLGAMEIDFAWDAEQRLTQRLVKYQENPVIQVDLHRDASGRVDRVETAGSWVKLPLTYTLTYDGSASRPDTLVLSSRTQNLLTLGFTYDDKTAPFGGGAGLGVLNFDSHLRTLSVAVDGGADALPVLSLDFPLTAANPAAIAVYDTLGKNTADTRKLIGTLTWSFDPALHQTGLVWKLASNTKAVPDWTYTAGWGTWAEGAAGMVTAAEAWGKTLEETASQALALADSFDVEKILQLVQAVPALPAQLPAVRDQFAQSAASLFDQVKAASGN